MQILRFAQDDIGGGFFSIVLEDLLRHGQFPVSTFEFQISIFQFPIFSFQFLIATWTNC